MFRKPPSSAVGMNRNNIQRKASLVSQSASMAYNNKNEPTNIRKQNSFNSLEMHGSGLKSASTRASFSQKQGLFRNQSAS